ncbi:anaerobic ribonucleoside-triphosphate reductase activating protein [Lachnospiraceae bacterium 2_1_46FAA]|nr:anaerobic ribonucleoside-triphosphate reductase activating protein [Lachnospiraceae bacterium 2_1_46FAA]
MLRLAGIVNDSIVDGPGIRITIFGQGCPHHCHGCQNPETWSDTDGTLVDEREVVQMIETNPLAKGVTFSGGEPFAQAESFNVLAELLKDKGYEVASYSGYTFEELLNGTEEQRGLLKKIDVLIDGRYEEDKKSLNIIYRGSVNQRIIDVPESLKQGTAVEITGGRWAGEYL